MAEPIRCPDCGASNPPGAGWCGQCLRRFGEAAPATQAPPPEQPSEAPAGGPPAAVSPPALEAVPSAQQGVRREGNALVWTCPACDTVNSMDALNCTVCGTPLAKLFAPTREAPPQRSRNAVLAMTGVLPGSGHIALGMTAAGIGRAVLYLWTMLVGVFLAIRDVRRNAGMVHALGYLFILAAVGVWVLSVVEAARAARGDRTLIAGGRTLTWATAGLTFLLFLGLAVVARSR